MRPALLLLAVLTLAPLASGTTSSYAPDWVFAAKAPTLEAVVRWTAGEEAADSYRIYGLSGGAPVFLREVSGTDTVEQTFESTVPGTYSTYAVSGVKNSIESPLVSTTNMDTECIRYDFPDGLAVDRHCLDKPRLVKFRVP